MSFKVTAITSVYQADAFLQGCLEDLSAQTLFGRGQLEVIVVDSGSPGREAEIVRAFIAAMPKTGSEIVYVRTERETLYAAWSRAAAMARGDYLTSANADDRHDPRCLELLAAALDAHPEVALAYPDSDVTRDANAPFAQAKRCGRLGIKGAAGWPEFDRDLLFEQCYVGPHPMWRRALHDRYGDFDATMKSAGDYEYWLRLAAAGEKFLRVAPGGAALSLYLENAGSISLSNIDLNWHESETARQRHWRDAWGTPPWCRAAAPHFARLRERIGSARRIAIYGAGKHTLRYLPLFKQSVAPAEIVAVLDDAPRGQTLGGVRIIETTRWRETACDGIVVSSDKCEAQMSARLAEIVGPACPVFKLYESSEAQTCP